MNHRESEHRGELRPLPWRNRARSAIVIFLALSSFTLSGCGPRRVKADFTGYEASYATTSNHEVLLNLARLEQHDPTYFFKLGQISSSYRMEAGLSGFGQYTPQGANTGVEVPSGGGTPSAIYENDPSFSFIPVNDETNASLLLKPVSEDVFYSLYQQGWRVDQLFRLMVDHIEVTLPEGDRGCKVEIIRNVPPPAYYAPQYAQSERILSRYATFLRVSAIVYELQKHGLLQLGGPNAFVPLDRKSALASSDAAPKAKDLVDAAAKDQVWEMDESGKWLLGGKKPEPRFELSSVRPEGEPVQEMSYGEHVAETKKFLDELFKSDDSLAEFQNNAPELTDILEILYNGFAIGGSPADRTSDLDTEMGPCPTETARGAAQGGAAAAPASRISFRLVMRSLLGLMAASAQEEESFDALEAANPPVHVELGENRLLCDVHQALQKQEKVPDAGRIPLPGCGAATNVEVPFNRLVPGIERLPVLRLTWRVPKSKAAASSPLTVAPPPAVGFEKVKGLGLAVRYKDQNYWIADADPAKSDTYKTETAMSNGYDWPQENQYWNRDMFRLICELSAQVTVDISKFPLPEILQLRTE
jgi:hypothetical protein